MLSGMYKVNGCMRVLLLGLCGCIFLDYDERLALVAMSCPQHMMS